MLLPTARKSHASFLLVCLHLTLAHSNGQGHDYAQFDWNISKMVADTANISTIFCLCLLIGPPERRSKDLYISAPILNLLILGACLNEFIFNTSAANDKSKMQ